MLRTGLGLGVSLLAMAASAPALGAATSWSGGTSSWFTSGNWNNGVPGAADAATVGNGGTAQINGGAFVQTLSIGSGSTVDLQSGGSLSASGGIFVGTGPSQGTLTLSGSSSLTSAITLANAIVNSQVSGTLSNAIALNQSYGSFINANPGTTLTLAGPIGGGTIIFGGGGKIILAGNDATANFGEVNTGTTLQIGNGGTTGDLGTGSVGVLGTLIFSRSDTLTVNNVIDGTGTININSGTVIFDNNMSPGLSLIIAPGATFQGGPGSAAVTNNGSLIFFRTAEYDGNINGSGSVSVTGGTAILTAANTYTGGTTISPGATLQLGTGLQMGTVVGGIVDNGVLALDGRGIVANAISGSGSLTKSGYQQFAILTAANSYTGGTTINSSVLQIGNGGTTGSLIGNVALVGPLGSQATLSFDRSDTIVYSGVVSGTGFLSQDGTGTLILTGNNTYTGSTGINNGAAQTGTLQIGNGGTSGAIASDVFGNGALVFDRSDSITYGYTINFVSSLTQAGSGTLILTGLNSYGSTTINGGTLQVGNGGTSGTIGTLVATNSMTGNVTDNGTLAFDRSDAVTFAGVISGSGSLTQIGGGTLVLTGASSYTGGTLVTAGTLQLGPGASLSNGGALTITGGTFDLNGNTQTVAALSGTGGAITLGSGSLTTNSASNTSLAAVISGNGSLTKAGTGTLTLAGTNTFTGGTTVSAGTLNVTGSIAGSAVSVANGAALTGTGKVGAVTVASGGLLSPIASGVPGTLTVQGNLALASGAYYGDLISPTITGLTAVSGTASVNGTLIVIAAAGPYTLGQRYTLLTAAGGLSGTFSSFSTTGLGAYRSALGYDANSVFLTLSPIAITPLLPPGLGGNPTAIAKGIDAAVVGGATLNSGFNALFGLSGAALGNAVTQLSGETSANAAQAASQAFLPFVSMLMSEGVAGGGDLTAANFAPGGAYGADGAPKPAQLATGAVRVWGSGYGSHTGIAADPVSGSQSLKAGDAGLAAGIEMQVSEDLVVGAAAGGGHASFAAGTGRGASNDAMLGAYGRLAVMDRGYLAGAFSYGWHDIATLRVLTISGTDLLSGKYTAHDAGLGLEGGWRLDMDGPYAVVPYAAFVWDDFQAPAYGETALSGSANFALAFKAHDSDFGRSELGAKAGRGFAIDGDVLDIDVSAAWAHELYGAPLALAAFQALPASNFIVQGAKIADDTALLGLGFDWKTGNGLFYGARIDSQLGPGTTALAGTANIAYRWQGREKRYFPLCYLV